jgi:small-conductance mechanosensitive channel
MERATYHLIKAVGCYAELNESDSTIQDLEKEIANLRQGLNTSAEADSLSDLIDETQDQLTAKQKQQRFWRKVGTWIKTKTAEFIAYLLGIAAATEAVYIIYTQLAP